MKEVLRTGDVVRISYARSVLRGAGIECAVLDQGMSSMYPGQGMWLAQRVMVADEDAGEAKRLLDEALGAGE